jgi:hypothetical protein
MSGRVDTQMAGRPVMHSPQRTSAPFVSYRRRVVRKIRVFAAAAAFLVLMVVAVMWLTASR